MPTNPRTAARKLDLTTPYQTTYTFLQNSSGGETTLVSGVTEGGKTYNYTYDARGNITSIKEGTEEKLRYTYDSLDQLIRVDDAYEGKTHTYTYDTGGNLTSRATYAYTTGELGEAESTVTYGYNDTNWKDKLTAYNAQEITYDAIGNPLIYRDGMTFTWQHGRELASYAKNGTTYTYNYDDDGYRVKKQAGTTETIYYRNGSTLLTQKTGTDRLDFFYDENEQLLGFKDNGTKYYYTKNLQGDITGILDAAGTKVVEYTYDAWGKSLTCTGTKASTVGVKNPFRYRGYYYDAESGLYYLNSRYYDPVVGRFVNADEYICLNQGILGANVFLYCNNCPIIYKDELGTFIFSGLIKWVGKQIRQVIVKAKASQIKKSLKSQNAFLPTGEPNSTQWSPNGKTKREYGPDGRATKDTDYTDHGNPKQHPDVPHEHDWTWEGDIPHRGEGHPVRNQGNKMLGGLLIIGSGLGVLWVAINDVSIIGIADDGALPGLLGLFGSGLEMIK